MNCENKLIVSLIPGKAEYADLWKLWRSQANMMQFNPVTQVDSNQLRERIANSSSDLSQLCSSKTYLFFIEWQGHLVGNVSLSNVNEPMQFAEIGYAIDETFSGQGIGTAAVKLFVSKIFLETKLRKLIAYVHNENIASRKILDRTGFTLEGTLREHYIVNGKPVNELLFGLLRFDVLLF